MNKKMFTVVEQFNYHIATNHWRLLNNMEGKSDRRADTVLKTAGSVMSGMGFNYSAFRQYTR